MDGQFQYFSTIDFKEGRYRVQVNNIQIIPSMTLSIGGVRSSEAPVAYSDIMLRNDNTFRKNKLAQRSLECVDQYFLNKFAFISTENDW
jgi:hypothetical protein